MDRRTRQQLRTSLLAVAPWLAATDVGPQAVEAGRCEACDVQPRLVPTCGPGAPGALCRECALELGDEGWCEGHHATGEAARAWASALPDRWADLVIAWWVATGEVRVTGGWPELDTSTLPPDVQRAFCVTGPADPMPG
jgi:hypothetical protein